VSHLSGKTSTEQQQHLAQWAASNAVVSVAGRAVYGLMLLADITFH